jgi:hypothetical protein
MPGTAGAVEFYSEPESRIPLCPTRFTPPNRTINRAMISTTLSRNVVAVVAHVGPVVH